MNVHAGTGLALFLAILASAPGAQEEKKVPRILAAAVETQGERCRVTIRGEADGPDGAVLVLRVLPRTYQLGGDGRSLVPSVAEAGSVSCRAEVHRGAFAAALVAPRLFEQEIRIQALPAVPGEPVHAQRVVFFDAAWIDHRLRREVKTFARHQKALAEFIAQLEPFERSGTEVPVKTSRRLTEINDEVASWAEGTPLAAAASVLARVLNDLWMSVPWAELPGSARRVVSTSPLTQGYEETGPKKEAKVETAKWAVLLARAPEVALREAIVAIAVSLEDAAARLERPESDRARASRGDLKTLQGLYQGLSSGELSATYGAYAPAADAAAAIASLVEAASALPSRGTPDAAALESLREQARRLAAARAKILQPAE